MKIFGLDGREYSWNPSHKSGTFSDKNKSKLHISVRNFLKSEFPYDRILEEVTLPGTRTSIRKSTLYADFFIPNRSMIVEAHGEQHYKYNSFFFKDKKSFYRAKARDNDKRNWCEQNGITMVELSYKDNEDEWRQLLNE